MNTNHKVHMYNAVMFKCFFKCPYYKHLPVLLYYCKADVLLFHACILISCVNALLISLFILFLVRL